LLKLPETIGVESWSAVETAYLALSLFCKQKKLGISFPFLVFIQKSLQDITLLWHLGEGISSALGRLMNSPEREIRRFV